MFSEKFKIALTTLERAAIDYAGGPKEGLILSGTVLAIIFALGSVIANRVFSSERGRVAITLACALPFITGSAAWLTAAAIGDPRLLGLDQQSGQIALASGALVGVLTIWQISSRILGLGLVKTISFLCLIFGCSYLGATVARSSVSLYDSGSSNFKRSGDVDPLGE